MAKVNITFYGALAQTTRDRKVEVEGSALKDALESLATKYGKLFTDRIYNEEGKIRRFVNIYINGKDIRFLNHLETELKERDRVSIIPAVGGG